MIEKLNGRVEEPPVEIKLTQLLLLPFQWIRAHAHNIEVVSLIYVAAY